MKSRLAHEPDIAPILALQDLNLVTKLDETQKKDGFVTTPFTAEQLRELIALDGLFVVEHPVAQPSDLVPITGHQRGGHRLVEYRDVTGGAPLHVCTQQADL